MANSLNLIFPSNGQITESDILMLKRFHPDVKDVGKLDITLIHLGDKNFGGNLRDNLNGVVRGFFGE